MRSSTRQARAFDRAIVFSGFPARSCNCALSLAFSCAPFGTGLRLIADGLEVGDALLQRRGRATIIISYLQYPWRSAGLEMKSLRRNQPFALGEVPGQVIHENHRGNPDAHHGRGLGRGRKVD
jgi:hypothetical protein